MDRESPRGRRTWPLDVDTLSPRSRLRSGSGVLPGRRSLFSRERLPMSPARGLLFPSRADRSRLRGGYVTRGGVFAKRCQARNGLRRLACQPSTASPGPASSFGGAGFAGPQGGCSCSRRARHWDGRLSSDPVDGIEVRDGRRPVPDDPMISRETRRSARPGSRSSRSGAWRRSPRGRSSPAAHSRGDSCRGLAPGAGNPRSRTGRWRVRPAHTSSPARRSQLGSFPRGGRYGSRRGSLGDSRRSPDASCGRSSGTPGSRHAARSPGRSPGRPAGSSGTCRPPSSGRCASSRRRWVRSLPRMPCRQA